MESNCGTGLLVLGHLGADRDPNAVTVEHIRELVASLRSQPNRRGGTMGDGNVRHHLNALSGVFRRAASEGFVPPGYNPVGALLEKPSGKPGEARWLEVPDAALLLEAARTYPAPIEGDALRLPPARHLPTHGRARDGGLRARARRREP